MSPYHHGNLRGTLIEAGIELINCQGDEGFSLRKVCARCGVSQAAPYSHFADKEELMEAMKAHVLEGFTEALKAAADGVTDQSDPKVLIAIGKEYVLYFLNRPEHFTFMFAQPRFTVNLTMDVQSGDNFPPYELLKEHALRVYPHLSTERMEDLLIAMWSTVHGLASIATMKNVRYDRNWADKIEDIIWNERDL